MRFIYSAKAATKLSPQPSRPSCSSGGLPELDPIAFGIGDPTESADSIHAEMLAIAKGESGLLQYDYFMSADERTCVVREAYVSSDAVLVHMGCMGDLLPRLMELGGGMQVEAFGTLSPALSEAAVAFQPAVYSYLQGL